VFFRFREFQRQKFQERHETFEGGFSESHELVTIHRSNDLCKVKTSPKSSSSSCVGTNFVLIMFFTCVSFFVLAHVQFRVCCSPRIIVASP
jgi:hypothetical protein